MEELKWYGWKNITVSVDLIGDDITKGDGMWEKDYTYIKIPSGYGYDNYCFLLSKNIVHFNPQLDKDKRYYFSIHHNMNIELIYDPEAREKGKRYKRYKISGYELFEKIFSAYEINYEKECKERLCREQEEKEKRNKTKMGSIVCGVYIGNNYTDYNSKYEAEYILKAFFFNSKAYSNSKFDKIKNVKEEFVIIENIDKHTFFCIETILNAYLREYYYYKEVKEKTIKFKEFPAIIKKSKTLMKIQPEALVEVGLLDISDNLIALCDTSMEEIKARMMKHIEKILK